MTRTPLNQRDVVLVDFPFTDLTTSKKRPAVVVSHPDVHGDLEDVVLAAITSQSRDHPTDVKLGQWEEAGLLKPSTVRTGKLVTISKTLISRRLGQIQSEDWDKMKRSFQELTKFELK